MSETNDLIARARKLASLADDATPSPWKIIEASGRLVHRGDMAYCDSPECSCLEDGLIASAQTKEDARLIAAAPEMARLLVELSDKLEQCEANFTKFAGTTFFVCPDCGAKCVGED